MPVIDIVRLALVSLLVVILAVVMVSPYTIRRIDRFMQLVKGFIESRSRSTTLSQFVKDNDGWSHLQRIEVLKDPGIPRQLRIEAYKTMLSLLSEGNPFERIALASLRLNKKWARPVEEWTVSWMLMDGETSWSGCTSWSGDSTVDSWIPYDNTRKFCFADEHEDVMMDVVPSYK